MEEIQFKDKIDANVAKEYIDKFLKADLDLNNFLSETKYLLDNVVKNSKAYLNIEVENVLKNIDIDEINNGDLSVRTTPLKNAGYTNYLKIYKLQDIYKLTKINGISSATAYKIRQIVYNDAKRLKETTIPRFDLDNKTTHASNLLRALYEYKNTQDFLIQAKDLNNKYHSQIIDLTRKAEVLTSKLKSFFSSKSTKQEALNALQELQAIENENYIIDTTMFVEKFTYIKNAKIKAVWEDFKESSADYYAILEHLSGLNFKNITDKNGLSKSLIDSINELEPDLTGLKCTLRSYQEFGTKYIFDQG